MSPEVQTFFKPERVPGEARRERTPAQKADDAEWEKAKRQVLARDRYTCRALVSNVCTFRAGDVHHKRPRGRGGRHDLENLIAVCRRCHDWIDRHPTLAEESGLLLPSGPLDEGAM